MTTTCGVMLAVGSGVEVMRSRGQAAGTIGVRRTTAHGTPPYPDIP
jgi:hypothetical protein